MLGKPYFCEADFIKIVDLTLKKIASLKLIGYINTTLTQ